MPPRDVPPKIDGNGLLVGWSLEHEHSCVPTGFSLGPVESWADDRYLDPILHDNDGHLMTIAPTGTGKGTSCLIPTLLTYDGPVIVIDPKGEALAVTARRRREMGQDVLVLDPFMVTDVAGAERISLNPLQLIEPGSETLMDDAAMVCELLQQGQLSPKDPFWDVAAEQVLTAVIAGVAATALPRLRDLSTVRTLLNETPEALAEAFDRFRTIPEDLKQPLQALVGPNDKMAASILAVARTHVGFLRGDTVLATLGAETGRKLPPLDIGAITDSVPVSLFIVLPPDKLASHGKLLRLWVGTLLAAVLRRRVRPARRTLFLLDEAAQLGPLRQLKEAVTLLRGYGVQVWSFWQDLSQLQARYPAEWESLFHNCWTHQFFGVTNWRLARSVADLTGFAQPDMILELDADEMLLSLKGDSAVIAQRPYYRTDTPYAGLWDENPFYLEADQAAETAERPQRRWIRQDAELPEPPQPTDDAAPQGDPAGELPIPPPDWVGLAGPVAERLVDRILRLREATDGVIGLWPPPAEIAHIATAVAAAATQVAAIVPTDEPVDPPAADE
ncbi:MAG: type IV secretory system conjugative DNA transfer family protein [Rhodospirillaceae bacterium]|nr:type IV secretory system conjugative DNA transfer family protein [Rhodospirillaceae bacterium]